MGYNPGKIYKLTFEDREGLEVRMRSASVNSLTQMVTLSAKLSTLTAAKFTIEDLATIDEFLDVFTGRLVSWNVVDDGEADVPATREGVGTQDLEFILEVAGAWMDAVSGVSAPLPPPSSSGEPSELARSINTVPLLSLQPS